MDKLKVLIVDDEKPSRDKIKSFLKDDKNVEEILEAENGIEAVEKINGLNPSLVFLDIQMPGMTGFEVLQNIDIEHSPEIIFATAYDQYAIDAFEVQAIDYLLKPFDYERFSKAFKNAIQRISLNKSKVEFNGLLQTVNKDKNYLKRILVSKSSKYSFVNIDDIYFISAQEKYIEINTENQKFLIRNTMAGIEQSLNPEKFARIHRSYIVNVDCIKELQPWSHGDYLVILKNDEKIKLARSYRDKIFNKM